LVSDEGADELKELGGLSKATAGVILRQLIAFSDQGADAFFGEPEFDPRDLLRTTPDGTGVVSVLELPALQDRPAPFSTSRLRAPVSLMAPSPPDVVERAVVGSTLTPRYAAAVDRESAYEMLAARLRAVPTGEQKQSVPAEPAPEPAAPKGAPTRKPDKSVV